MDEFSTYVSKFDPRINKAITRLDTTVVSVMDTIDVGLRKSVGDYILQPLYDVVDVANCDFLEASFTKMVEGLCFKAVVSFKTIRNLYIVDGSLSIFLVLFMYIAWRNQLDECEAAGAASDEAKAET